MVYTKESLKEISFPLGGIGTGCIGLTGYGGLTDWEIFNRPNKGSSNGYTHIAVKATVNGKSYCKVLQTDLSKSLLGDYEGKPYPDYSGFGFGPKSCLMSSFPHFKHCEFIGEFPIASLHFSDDYFPGKVNLTAFNPMIPLDSFDSSLPAAFFEISYHNETDSDIVFESVFSLQNPFESSVNKKFEEGVHKGVTLINAGKEKDEIDYGDLSIICDDPSEIQAYWFRGAWQDGIVTFWNEFSSDEPFLDRNYNDAGKNDTCSLVKSVTVKPGDTMRTRFLLSWNIPNRRNWWGDPEKIDESKNFWKNYYATVFESSKESGLYAIRHWDNLYDRTLQFKNELFASTIDPILIDAVSATMSVLKSATVSRLENGEFYGFEGCHEHVGACEGTCQHVYNYAYALCFLFPDLERSIRDLEFKHELYETGATSFRLQLPLSQPPKPERTCLDGQMGCIIKSYREWKISGNSSWLEKNWPDIKRILEFAWSEKNPDEWDLNKDGVLEGRQHHTLDMELFGPSSWLQSFYLAALSAAAEMADFMGEPEKAEEYREVYRKGKAWTKENLFNGSYFFHKIDLSDQSVLQHFGCMHYWNEETGEIKYQIGEGSEIDQMCGQWHAAICGLPDVFDKDQMHRALESMLKNNYKENLREFVNPWRVFALNDEAGSIICDYPDSARKPKIPITYCQECMHGFEYQFAGLLMSEGYIEDGIKVAKAVRDRYQGFNRNPWNEIECGSNYARSMASFAFLPILSGLKFDLPHGMIGFDPKVNKNSFRCFFSLGTGWGNVKIDAAKTVITLAAGQFSLEELRFPYLSGVSAVNIDGKSIPFKTDHESILFDRVVCQKCIEVIHGSSKD